MARAAKRGTIELVAGSDLETRGTREGNSDLRLWLRILTIHKLVNNEVRRRLREQFGMSLSRFDLLAQLDGKAEGMRMGELSKRLMVTTGNITGLVDELVAEGLVERLPDPTNRRASLAAMVTGNPDATPRTIKGHPRWRDVRRLICGGGLAAQPGPPSESLGTFFHAFDSQLSPSSRGANPSDCSSE